MRSMKTETNQYLTAGWRDSFADLVGENNAARLLDGYPVAEVQHRTDWRAMWELFDAAREDADFTLTETEWDDVEASIVALGGVNTREELAEAEGEDEE